MMDLMGGGRHVGFIKDLLFIIMSVNSWSNNGESALSAGLRALVECAQN